MAAWEQIDVVDGAVVVDGFDEGLSDWEVLSSVEEVVENLDSCGDVNELSDGAVAESCKKSPEESFKIVVEVVAGITHPNSSQTREQRFARNASGNNGSSSSALSLSPTTLTPSSLTPSTQNMSSSHKSLHLKSGQKVVSEAHFHGTKERPQHNSSHRRGRGPHQHRYSSHSHRYGSRKDQDRPSCDWNFQRMFRDVHPQPFEILPSRITRPFPTPHDSSPSIAPQSPTMQHLDPSVSYHDLPFQGVPIQPKSTRGRHDDFPHYFYLRRLDPELQSKIVSLINFYFSNENLNRDIYLRNNMDEQGWVLIELIAGFGQVKALTYNFALLQEDAIQYSMVVGLAFPDKISLVKYAIQSSTMVEVKDDKVRRRDDWIKWLSPESAKDL